MGNGFATSSVTGEDIIPGYDYGAVTERDKLLVNEILSILKNRKQVPVDMIVEEINTKFNLEEIPMMKLEDTLWHQLTKDEPIAQNIQGFRMSLDEKQHKIKVPFISFQADLDFLDGFINRLVQKVNNLK
jgi:uncharacterized protein (UPF0210 family)